MTELVEKLIERWDRLCRSVDGSIATIIAHDRCLPEGAAGYQIRRDKMYFTIRVNEAYLAKNQGSWSSFDPLVVVVNIFDYDGERIVLPKVFCPTQVHSFRSDGTPSGRVFLVDAVAVGPCPYRGGPVDLFVSLYQVGRAHHSRALLQSLGTLSELAGDITDLHAGARIGIAMLESLEALIGLQQTTCLAAQRISLATSELSPFTAGFSALIATRHQPATPPDPARLSVEDRRLQMETSKAVKPYRDSDFVLLGIEGSTARGEKSVMSFYRMKVAAMQSVWDGEGGLARAKAGLSTVYQQMLSSSDFTQLEVDQLFESWLTEFEVVKQQATRRHALAIEEKTETSNPTVLKLDEAVRRLELYKHSIVSDASPDSHTVDLFVTSTRKLRANGLITSVTDERSDKLAFGAVRVRVPDEHRIGEVERPLAVRIFGLTIYRERQDDKQHFVIKSKSWITQDEFLEAIREHDAKQALIFVHGFNTTFDEGVFRLAQIVWDTQFDGVPILFSWPSKGTILSYLYDRESSTFSVNGFLELLTLLQTSTDISTIHILAHSMGNQIVVSALANSKDIALKALGEVILAAPDVDRDVFKGLAVRIAGIPSRGVTLYASSADKAMSASRKLAQGPRAGDVLPPPDGPVVLPKIETIDVTAVGDELFGLNHDTFAVHRSIIDDIGRLILRGDRPPNQRSVEIRGVPEGRQPPLYWRYAR